MWCHWRRHRHRIERPAWAQQLARGRPNHDQGGDPWPRLLARLLIANPPTSPPARPSGGRPSRYGTLTGASGNDGTIDLTHVRLLATDPSAAQLEARSKTQPGMQPKKIDVARQLFNELFPGGVGGNTKAAITLVINERIKADLQADPTKYSFKEISQDTISRMLKGL